METNEQKTITGTEALRRARLISKTKDAHFLLVHLTCNLKEGTGGEMRVVRRCRLRPSLRAGVTKIDPDHYLPYTDCDLDEPRECFKKLVRLVAFPPDYETLKVDWFTENENENE
jgi:hypothetical protein